MNWINSFKFCWETTRILSWRLFDVLIRSLDNWHLLIIEPIFPFHARLTTYESPGICYLKRLHSQLHVHVGRKRCTWVFFDKRKRKCDVFFEVLPLAKDAFVMHRTVCTIGTVFLIEIQETFSFYEAFVHDRHVSCRKFVLKTKLSTLFSFHFFNTSK